MSIYFHCLLPCFILYKFVFIAYFHVSFSVYFLPCLLPCFILCSFSLLTSLFHSLLILFIACFLVSFSAYFIPCFLPCFILYLFSSSLASLLRCLVISLLRFYFLPSSFISFLPRCLPSPLIISFLWSYEWNVFQM